MDPLTVASMAYGAGNLAGSLFANPQAANYSGSKNTLNSGFESARIGLNNNFAAAQNLLTTDNVLNNAAHLRQDANAYENAMTTDAVLAAYGGDPLGGQTKSELTRQLAQLNRANYQSGLQNAMGLAGNRANMQTQLAEGMSQLDTSKAQALANIEAKQAEAQAAAKSGQGVLTRIFS